MKTDYSKEKVAQLGPGLRPGRTVGGTAIRGHGGVEPGPEVSHVSVNPVLASQGALVAKTAQQCSLLCLNSLTLPDISNEDVLVVAPDRDGERAAAVALAAVLALLPARTEHLLRDPAPHGVNANGVGHHRHLDLQQLVRGGATVGGGAPT